MILEREIGAEERAHLLAHDDDPFNRWEAGRAYALDLLTLRAEDEAAAPDPVWGAAMAAVADDARIDPAFKALALGLPGEEEIIAHIARIGRTPDPLAVHLARRAVQRDLGAALGDRLEALYAANETAGPFSADAEAAGRRALRGRALALICARDDAPDLARAHFAAAGNMTEAMAALALLAARGAAGDELAAFHDRWRSDRLVIDKWFAVQASQTPPERAVETVAALSAHPDFDWRNPNRFRALIGAFAAGNPAGFHRADGAGYDLVANWLIRLDPVNPQTAARLAGGFGAWRMFDADRQARMKGSLRRIGEAEGASRDMGEIVARALRDDG